MKHNYVKSFFILSCILTFIIMLIANDTDELIFRIKEGIKSGKIAYTLTDPEEIKALLGEPSKQREDKDGGMQILGYEYPDRHRGRQKTRPQNERRPEKDRSILGIGQHLPCEVRLERSDKIPEFHYSR